MIVERIAILCIIVATGGGNEGLKLPDFGLEPDQISVDILLK